MAKIYPEDKSKQDISEPQKPMGVYDRPSRKKPSKAMIILIVIAIVIVIAMLLAGFVHGAENLFDTSLILLFGKKGVENTGPPM